MKEVKILDCGYCHLKFCPVVEKVGDCPWMILVDAPNDEEEMIEVFNMKVQVLVDEDVVIRIDKQAKRKGLSRSSYCAQAIISDLLHDEAQEQAYLRLMGTPSEEN